MAANGPRAFLDQTYQLQINTVTTVITFLLVALLQNTQARDNVALQDKLNAIAEGLSVLMDKVHSDEKDELQDALRELCVDKQVPFVHAQLGAAMRERIVVDQMIPGLRIRTVQPAQ